jgi:hypothetical protein
MTQVIGVTYLYLPQEDAFGKAPPFRVPTVAGCASPLVPSVRSA